MLKLTAAGLFHGQTLDGPELVESGSTIFILFWVYFPPIMAFFRIFFCVQNSECIMYVSGSCIVLPPPQPSPTLQHPKYKAAVWSVVLAL